MLFRPLLSPNWNAPNARTASRHTVAIRSFLPGSALCGVACMVLPAGALLRVAARVTDTPDGVRTVIGYEERAVGRHGDADRASPDVAVVDHKTGDEILVLATGLAGLMHRYSDHFVPGANGSVPRAVLGGEDIAAIFGGKLRTLIKDHFERSIVGLQENIGDDGLVFQFGMLAAVARILMGADVPPGPTVEAALLNMSDVVGN